MKRFANRIGTMTAMALLLATGASAQTAASAQPCPISYTRLDMPYKHEGGVSTPTVVLSFVNDTHKKIVKARFGLSVLVSQGNEVPYDQGLTFTAGAEPGKMANAKWELDMDKISMDRIGETVYLKSVRFEDNTTWQDDGNQRCRDEINYGPK
jgi:hypothetical protein